ncbi:hypothetical protein V6N11_001918 [Hibiscus sabdariffa]|uniref:Uncharacterized protein n=1 Tax=Hibiscus sabdariffa TaxID=183260 RepID=A0ABR2QTN6_9ROSI
MVATSPSGGCLVMKGWGGARSALNGWPQEACARGGDGLAKVAPHSLLFPPKLGALLGNTSRVADHGANWWVVVSGNRAEVGS